MTKFYFKAVLPVLFGVVLPFGAFAAQLVDPCDAAKLVEKAKNVIAFVVFTLVAVAMLYAAFLFLTSGGSEEKVKSAKTVFLWALIGTAVLLFASYAAEFMTGIVGGELAQNCQF